VSEEIFGSALLGCAEQRRDVVGCAAVDPDYTSGSPRISGVPLASDCWGADKFYFDDVGVFVIRCCSKYHVPDFLRKLAEYRERIQRSHWILSLLPE
jgi:hypothetical protein